jgi:O-antigen/teichoic acid export membrane protein
MRVLAAFVLNIFFNFVVGLLVAKFLGPEEYGRFALSLATAMAVQTAFLDWLRLGATRFYSERARGEEPALRATLDVAFALIACGLGIGATCLFMTGVRFPLSNGLIALAIGAAVSNGLFDFNTALVRARFHDQLYVKLVLVKNVLALLLTGSGAFYFGSAKMALIGSVLSLSGSVVAARAALADPGAEARLASLGVARSIWRYTLPIVASNLLYLCIPLANRSLITIFYGFAETGQFSLAYDIGTKAVQAIGSTLDVLLFQIAVAAHDHHGAEHAKLRVGQNIAIVTAVVLPACMGIWLVLPSLEALIVPQQYRGPFGQLLTLMMPGLFFFALILYAVNPIFQIAKRTAPLIAAALAAAASDPILLFLLPRTHDASSLAVAQSGAFAVAFLTLVAVASLSKPIWPRARDIAATILGTAVMVAMVLPLRRETPGASTFALQIVEGVAVYTAFVALFDIAGLRTMIVGQLRPMMARFRPS